MTMLQDFTNRNKTMALRAIRLQAGKIALSLIKQMLKAKVPAYLRGYLNSPFTSFILANGVNVAVLNDLHKGNKTVEQLSDAMLEASMLEMLEAINIEQLLSEFLTMMPKAELKALEQANQAVVEG
jgi:hypothetical protein